MTPAPGPRPPPDLWARLARLDERCEMRLTSEPEPQSDGSWHWVWRVVIRPRADEQGPPKLVLVMARSAVEALTEALAQAEARGWAGDSAPQPTAPCPDARPDAPSG